MHRHYVHEERLNRCIICDGSSTTGIALHSIDKDLQLCLQSLSKLVEFVLNCFVGLGEGSLNNLLSSLRTSNGSSTCHHHVTFCLSCANQILSLSTLPIISIKILFQFIVHTCWFLRRRWFTFSTVIHSVTVGA